MQNNIEQNFKVLKEFKQACQENKDLKENLKSALKRAEESEQVALELESESKANREEMKEMRARHQEEIE